MGVNMPKITASANGDYSDKSIRLRDKSYNQITLQMNIHEDPLDITYTVEQSPQINKTLSGGGIVRVDEQLGNYIYTIDIPETDNIKKGCFKHFVQLTTETGQFKLSLDKGRVRIES